MKPKRLAAIALAVGFALAGLGGNALAQAPKAAAKQPTPAATPLKLTITGKIVKDESMGGYYIQGQKPPEVFRILNQNPKVLENYVKSGKSVNIEAQVVMGDNLAIEKIEGKKYQEGKTK